MDSIFDTYLHDTRKRVVEMPLIHYLVLLTVSYPVLVTEAQKRNSFDETTGNLKLDKKIWEEK